MESRAGAKRVAIVYPDIPHYREAVFTLLSRSDARHRYEIFADTRASVPSVSTIAPEKSRRCSTSGTLNWRFIRNRWLASNMLWQSTSLHIAMSSEFNAVIFLGNVKYVSTWLAALLARVTGKRVLMWTHGLLKPETGVRGLLRRMFYRLAHGLLLYGHRARALLAAQGFSEDRLYVVYNSLDTEAQLRALAELDADVVAKTKSSLGMPVDAPLLICIGRMVAGKELHLLPPVLADLKAKGRNVHLAFIGGGPVREELYRLAVECGVRDEIHFAGEIYRERDIAPLLYSADLCVSPGSVGLTAMHALVYGTPVITHDDVNAQKPEFEIIRSGFTGAFFRRGDSAHLADTIEAWLSRTTDRDQVRRICREHVLRFYTPQNQRAIIEAAVDGVSASEMNRLEVDSESKNVPERNAAPLSAS